MEQLTQTELDAIRARAEKATDGNWSYFRDSNGLHICTPGAKAPEIMHRESDTNFAIHAREDVPKLLAEVEELLSAKDLAGRQAYEYMRYWEKSKAEAERLYDLLWKVDCHIRSTSEPIPYIIEELKTVLPEYQTEALRND